LQLSTTQVGISAIRNSVSNNDSIFDVTGTFTSRNTANDTLRWGYIRPSLVATASGQYLIGLDISPNYTAFNADTNFIGLKISNMANTQNNGSGGIWMTQDVGGSANGLHIAPANTRYRIVYIGNKTNVINNLGGSIVLGASGTAIQLSGGTQDAVNTLDVLGNAYIGTGSVTASARLHVKGDGTNPAVRIEGGVGQDIQRWYWSDNTTLGLSVNSLGNIYFGQGAGSGYIYGGANSTNYITIARGGYHIEYMVTQPFLDYNGQSGFHQFKTNNNRSTSGTGAIIYAQSSFVPSGNSTANPRGLWIDYTLNRNGFTTSGTATGIFLNATETDITGMTHNLMDLQVGSSSKFLVSRTGELTTGSSISSGLNMTVVAGGAYIISTRGYLEATSNGVFALKNNAGAAASLNISGITISDYAGITSSVSDLPIVSTTYVRVNTAQMIVGNGGYGHASAKLDVESTTKGFLPPRMTTTQRDNIATPAEGLVIYNTTTQVLNFYNGTAWGAV